MKIRSLFAAALLTALCFAAPAHSSAGVLSGPWTYVKDRFNDGLDIFRLRAGFPDDGKGLGAKVRVTSLAQAGYIFFRGTYVGLDRRGVGVVNERRREGGVSLLYGSRNRMVPIAGNSYLKGNTDWSEIEDRRIIRNLPHWDDGRQRHLSIGAEVATPLFGLDVGLYPEEILDFALGFLIIDIYNDDELFGWDNIGMEATTLPGPDAEAPFAKERLAQEEFLLRMLEKELGERGQLEGEAPMPPPVAEDVDTISEADADALMDALEAEMQPTPEPEPLAMEPEAEPEVIEPEMTPEAPEELASEPGAEPAATPEEAAKEETPVLDNSRGIRYRNIERTKPTVRDAKVKPTPKPIEKKPIEKK